MCAGEPQHHLPPVYLKDSYGSIHAADEKRGGAARKRAGDCSWCAAIEMLFRHGIHVLPGHELEKSDSAFTQDYEISTAPERCRQGVCIGRCARLGT